MTRLAEIEAHIGSIGELLGIVGAMRSLAGMRVQEAQRALPGIRRYADAMAAAIGGAMSLMPETAPDPAAARGPKAVILCVAEHGFVGGFNERLLDAAERLLEPKDTVFFLGTRGAAVAAGRGLHAGWVETMATRVSSVPETVRRLSSELYRRISHQEIARVAVIYARYRQGAAPTVEHHLLLPPDLASLRARRPPQPPLHTLDPDKLLERLLAEYVLALLMESAVESLASENAARFSAMGSAHENIAKKLDQLRLEARQARQSEITAEILELITGAEALTG